MCSEWRSAGWARLIPVSSLQPERDGNTPAAEYQAPHPLHKTLSSKSLKLNYTVTAPGHIHTEPLMLCHCWCNRRHLYSLVC